MSNEFMLATFNANSLRARMNIVMDWLRDNQPDVLCIQETKVQDHDFPLEVFHEAGWHVVYRGMKSYNGVALISREAPVETAFGLQDGSTPDTATIVEEEARVITARFPDLVVVNTYIPQGYETDSPKYEWKIRFLERLRVHMEHLMENRGTPVVWCGDFNIAPEDRDVYDPDGLRGHVCFNPQLSAIFQEFLNMGFVDVFRKHCPEAGEYTFWDYRMNAFKRNLGWRIDHILALKQLAERSAGVFVDRAPRALPSPSDHTFLAARFLR